MQNPPVKSFVVEFWSQVFQFLGLLSPFALLRTFSSTAKTARFVDLWVLAHLVLALSSLVVASTYGRAPFSICLVIYGFLRVFEIVVYQMNVLLFDEYRTSKAGKPYWLEGYRRMVLLLLHNYFEIIFWFAASYLVFFEDFSYKWGGGAGTVLGGIYSSFITMTTFGEFDVAPTSKVGAVVILCQSFVGLFMTLLSLARFISIIPTPKSKDEFEEVTQEETPVKTPPREMVQAAMALKTEGPNEICP